MNLRIAPNAHDATSTAGRLARDGGDDASLPPFLMELGAEPEPEREPAADPDVAGTDPDVAWRAWGLAALVAQPAAPTPTVAPPGAAPAAAPATAAPLATGAFAAQLASPTAAGATPDAATVRAGTSARAGSAVLAGSAWSAALARATPDATSSARAATPADARPEAIVRVTNDLDVHAPAAAAQPVAAQPEAIVRVTNDLAARALPPSAAVTVSSSTAPPATPERALRDAADALTRTMSTRAHAAPPRASAAAATSAHGEPRGEGAREAATAEPAASPTAQPADAVTVVSAPPPADAATATETRAPHAHESAAARAEGAPTQHVPSSTLVSAQGVVHHPSLGAIAVSATAPVERGAVDLRIRAAREDAAREIKAHASSIVAAVRAESPVASLRVEHAPVVDAAAQPRDAHGRLGGDVAQQQHHAQQGSTARDGEHQRAPRRERDDVEATARVAVTAATSRRVRFVL